MVARAGGDGRMGVPTGQPETGKPEEREPDCGNGDATQREGT